MMEGGCLMPVRIDTFVICDTDLLIINLIIILISDTDFRTVCGLSLGTSIYFLCIIM